MIIKTRSSFPLYFHLDKKYLPTEEQQRAWMSGGVVPISSIAGVVTYHAWIYQTWFFLQQAGYPCHLVQEMPEEGMVITYGDWSARFCHQRKNLPPQLFVIHVVADMLPNPLAHCWIFQNSAHQRYFPHSVFMPHWPLQGLLPRDQERGNRLENLTFMGNPENVASLFLSQEWQRRIWDEIGVHCLLPSPNFWHDYRYVDATIAIRSFNRERYHHKPATKLYNAWLAGVPLIAGSDSAFASDGESGRNFLTVHSSEELIAALYALKKDPLLRHQLVAEGKKAVQDFTKEATLRRWQYLVEVTLPRLVERWQTQQVWQGWGAGQCRNLFSFLERFRQFGIKGFRITPFQHNFDFSFMDSVTPLFYEKELAQLRTWLTEAKRLELQLRELGELGELSFSSVELWRRSLQKVEELLFYKKGFSFDDLRDPPLPDQAFLEEMRKKSQRLEHKIASLKECPERSHLRLITEASQELKKAIAAYYYWSQRSYQRWYKLYWHDAALIKKQLAACQHHRELFQKEEGQPRRSLIQQSATLALLELEKALILVQKEEKWGANPPLKPEVAYHHMVTYWQVALSYYQLALTQDLIEGKVAKIRHAQEIVRWVRRTLKARRAAAKSASQQSWFIAKAWNQVAYWAGGTARREIFFKECFWDCSYSKEWEEAVVATYLVMSVDVFFALLVTSFSWIEKLFRVDIDPLFCKTKNFLIKLSQPQRQQIAHFLTFFEKDQPRSSREIRTVEDIK